MAPRVTVAEVDEKFTAMCAGLDDRLVQLLTELRQTESRLSHVTHIPGHQRGLQRHSREIKELRLRIERLVADQASGRQVNERELAGLTEQVNTLKGDVATLTAKVQEHDSRLDGHETRLNDHDGLFAQLAKDNEERDGRTNIIGASVAQAHARIDVLEQVRGIHPVAWILGALTGVLAGIIWGVHDWTQESTVNGTKVVVENTAANTLWAAILAGLGVGLLVLFLVSLFTGGRRNPSRYTAEADAMAGVTMSRGRRDNTDRTQVQPVVPSPPSPPVASQQQ